MTTIGHHGLLFATAAAPAPPAQGWNPADKDPDIAISGTGDTIATLVSTGSEAGSVRAVTGRSSGGKRYFEITIGADPSFNCLVGVGNASASLADFPGIDANGWSWYLVTGQKYTNNTPAAFGGSGTNGDAIGVGIDFATMEMFIWINGSAPGGAMFTLPPDTYYPMWGPGTVGAGTRTATINTGQGAFFAGLPSGYSAWG